MKNAFKENKTGVPWWPRALRIMAKKKKKSRVEGWAALARSWDGLSGEGTFEPTQVESRAGRKQQTQRL